MAAAVNGWRHGGGNGWWQRVVVAAGGSGGGAVGSGGLKQGAVGAVGDGRWARWARGVVATLGVPMLLLRWGAAEAVIMSSGLEAGGGEAGVAGAKWRDARAVVRARVRRDRRGQVGGGGGGGGEDRRHLGGMEPIERCEGGGGVFEGV